MSTFSKKPKKPTIGILMLDSQFPRIAGDVGNEQTWNFPVLYKTVSGASPRAVVCERADGLLDKFVDAALELVEEGANGISTTCGFLSLFQEELADRVGVPVATSSLMQTALINKMLPAGKRAGILTISASSLTQEHLSKADVPKGTPVGSTEGGAEFTRAILNNETEMNVDLARTDNIEAAIALQTAHSDLGAIVLECTNMGPYAADIARVTGLPVFSIVTFINWFHAGLAPSQYE